MKKLLKLYILIFGLFFATVIINGQEKRLINNVMFGIGKPILDNGLAGAVGFHPEYKLHSRFSLEGQVSYLYTKITGSFLSGETGSSNSVNTLIGGRLYLSSDESSTRIFLNFLIGANLNKEYKNGIAQNAEFNTGLSGGGYVKINNLILGLAYETPQHIVLKAGFTF